VSKRRNRRLRSAARLFLLRGLLGLFAALSLKANHRIGRWLGLLAWRLDGRIRRITEENIQRCLPDWDEEQRTQLARNSLIETGKTVTETGAIWRWPRWRVEELVKEIEGWPHMEAAMAKGKGVIMLGPHLGAWELGGLLTATRTPTTILFRPPREPAFEALMTEARSRFGANLVPADLSGVRSLLKALKRGELVAILPDQEPSFGQGGFAPFFGQPAYTLTLVRTLLRKTGAQAIFAHAERLPDGEGFRFHYLPADELVPDGNLADDDETAALTALNLGVERLVRRSPEQYQWSYRRFRRQPTDGDQS